MRITIGSGNNRSTVTVPQGKAFRSQPYVERQRFERDFCHLAGIPWVKAR